MPFTASDNLRCRNDFPALRRMHGDVPFTYLDGPAGSQVPQQVIDAMTRYYTTCNANSHGEFATSHESDAAVTAARSTAAAFLGARSQENISFGQNMTTLAFALSRAFSRRFRAGDEVVITELDHEANRGPWLRLADNGVVVREVEVLPDGTLDYEDFERKVSDRTKLVCVGWASNALGTVNDVARIRQIAPDALLLVDAVHYAPHLVMDVEKYGIDFLLCSAYKFYGPHVGILYSRDGLLDELETDRLRTAPQQAPERIETGTLNFAAIAAVGAAIEYIASWGSGATLRDRIVDAMNATAEWEHRLARRYYEGVRQLKGVRLWGPDFSSVLRAPTVSVTFEGHDPEKVARQLGEQGIAVWNGDFYARRVAEKYDLYDRGGLLRTGLAMYNTTEEIDRLLSALGVILR